MKSKANAFSSDNYVDNLRKTIMKLFTRKKARKDRIIGSVHISVDMLNILERLGKVTHQGKVLPADVADELFNVTYTEGGYGEFTTRSDISYMFGPTTIGVRSAKSAWHAIHLTEQEGHAVATHVKRMADLKDILTLCANECNITSLKELQLTTMTHKSLVIRTVKDDKPMVLLMEDYEPDGDINSLTDGVVAYMNKYVV
jgi:hypothetical protein